MQITRINHVAINVHGAADEAREFYTSFMGLSEVPVQLPGRPPITEPIGTLWVEQEGVQMHVIGLPSNGSPGDPVGPHVSWYVADLDKAVSEVEGQDLSLRVFGEGRERIVWFTDPAGNTVELQQDPEC